MNLLDAHLCCDQRDVRRVQDLRSVRQALGPQLWRRVEGVPVAAAEPYLSPEPLPDQVLDLEGPVVSLQHVLYHLAVLVRLLGRHGDRVHRVETDVDYDGVILLDEVLVGGEAHVAVNYLSLHGGEFNALHLYFLFPSRFHAFMFTSGQFYIKIYHKWQQFSKLRTLTNMLYDICLKVRAHFNFFKYSQ